MTTTSRRRATGQMAPISVAEPCRQALLSLFLSVSGFFMEHRSIVMRQEVRSFLLSLHSLAHDARVNHAVELRYAVEKIATFSVVSSDLAVAEALHQARIVLEAEALHQARIALLAQHATVHMTAMSQ